MIDAALPEWPPTFVVVQHGTVFEQRLAAVLLVLFFRVRPGGGTKKNSHRFEPIR